MSKYKEMLLFDVADEHIGGWQEDLGYRGMMDMWKFHDENGKYTGDFICIEPYDDVCSHCEELGKECECEEVWVGNDKTGFHDTIDMFETYEKAIAFAKEFMKANPKGFVNF